MGTRAPSDTVADLCPIKIPKRKRRWTSAQILNNTYRATVISGMEFTKYKYGKGGRRMIWVDPMLENLYWGKSEEVRLPTGRFNITKAKGSIALKNITALIVDRKQNVSKCPMFSQRFKDHPETCMSFVTDERTLDLEADTSGARLDWATAIGNIAFGDRSQFVLGEEEDDFDDDESDMKALFESDRDLPPAAASTGAGVSAVEAYSRGYHQRSMSHEMQSEIESKSRVSHARTHSHITSVLMEQDSRFRRLAQFVQSKREEFGADRGALYLVDRVTNVLSSVIIEGQQGDTIVFEMGQDLVGACASSCALLIVPDAYADARFSQENDVNASYKTTSVLLAAVKDRAGRVSAVLEFRNKQDHQYAKDYFTVEHAAKLSRYATEMRELLAVIQDYEFQRTLKRVQDPIRFLNEVQTVDQATPLPRQFRKQAGLPTDSGDSSSEAGGSVGTTPPGSRSPSPQPPPSPSVKKSRRTNSMATKELKELAGGISEAYNAMQEARETLNADRMALFAMNPMNNTLESVIIEGNQQQMVTLKLGEGLIGAAAAESKVIVVDDVYDDERFNKDEDKVNAYKTTSVLCIPIFNPAGLIIGVCEFINKQDMPFKKGFFEEKDAKVVAPFLPRIARGVLAHEPSSPLTSTSRAIYNIAELRIEEE